MARKNVLLYPVKLAQSLSASFNSPPTIVKFTDNVAYQINVTASGSSGTFKVQASLDYNPDVIGTQADTTANWIDLTLAGGTPTISGSNDTILINLNQLPFNAIRLVYTSTVPGTGTCDIYIMSKQLAG